MATMNLSDEQQAVIGSEKPSLAISGTPGSGKTTLIREMIQQNIRQGYSPEDILFVSFGRKDADVFGDKLDEVNLGSVLSATCHGFCYRIATEDARKKKLKKWLSEQGTLNLVQGRARLELVDEAVTEAKVAYQIDYARDIDYLKSIGVRPDDAKAKYLLTPAVEWTAQVIEENPYQRQDLIGELKSCRSAVYQKYQEILNSRGLVDFGELQLWAEKAMQRDPELLDDFAYKVVYVDEAHDLSEQQWRIVAILLQKAELSRVNFDVSQCLLAGTMIRTGATTSKLIETIRPMDTVVTAIGRAAHGRGVVKAVASKEYSGWFTTITTASGHTLTGTNNHIGYVFIPRKVSNTNPKNYWFVYLMYHSQYKWRIGTTQDLLLRMCGESADAGYVIASAETKEEALYIESKLSLKYSIPTQTYEKHSATQMIYGDKIAMLNIECETETRVEKLFGDLGVDKNYPFHRPQGISKPVVYLNQCFQSWAKENTSEVQKNVSHVVSLETRNKDIWRKLGMKYPKISKSFTQLSEAEVYANSLGLPVVRRFANLAKANDNLSKHALAMPFGNMVVGMQVAILDRDEIIYDEIVSINRKLDTQVVYDIEVFLTNNFFANGIAVHNSIYSFRGAIGQGILKRVRDILPDMELLKLVENHRSAPQIVSHAETIIPRGMKATRDIQGTVQVYQDKFTDPEKHADEIVGIVSRWKDQGYNFGDMAILYRYRAPMVHAQVALTRAKIPNQVGVTPFTKLSEVKDLLAWIMMSDPMMMEKHPGPRHPFWRIYRAPAIALTDSQGYVIRNQKGIAMTLGSSWQKLATKRRGNLRELLQPDLYPLRYQQALILLRRNIEYVQTCNWPWDVLNYVVNIMTPRYWEYQLLMAGERLGNPHQHIKALMDVAKNFQDKGEFMNFMNGLDHVLKQNVVELTTIHQAKGKEWPCVIGVLSDEMIAVGHESKREEQRIRYVCATRPEQHLVETIV